MKLHWSPRSPFVRKVMILAHETGLVDRLEKVRSVVAMTKPNAELMKLNPLNKIPTLVTDDGLVLFDSDVISEYLDGLHAGPRLLPAEPQRRWQVLRWRALGSEFLDALILWRNERNRPETRRLPELLDAFELKTRTALDLLEREIEDVSRAQFSVGHIALGCALAYLDFRFPDVDWRSGHPRLAGWFAEFSRRPSVLATAPVDDE
jgi:glutathione S-transferase